MLRVVTLNIHKGLSHFNRRIVIHDLRDGQKIMKEACRHLWATAQDVDAIIFHQTTNFSVDIAEALDIPAIMTAFQPINPTGEFPYFGYDGPPPEPLFNRISLDPLFNRLSYVVQAAHQSYYDFPRDRMRAKLLGLIHKKLDLTSGGEAIAINTIEVRGPARDGTATD